MKIVCLVAGILFFGLVAGGMAIVLCGGLKQALYGPGWNRRYGGIALVIIAAGVVFIALYGLTNCVWLLADVYP